MEMECKAMEMECREAALQRREREVQERLAQLQAEQSQLLQAVAAEAETALAAMPVAVEAAAPSILAPRGGALWYQAIFLTRKWSLAMHGAVVADRDTLWWLSTVHAPVQHRSRPRCIASLCGHPKWRVLSGCLEMKETAESHAAMKKVQKTWKKGIKKFLPISIQSRPVKGDQADLHSVLAPSHQMPPPTRRTTMPGCFWTASRLGRWWQRCGVILN
eukprot:s2379_g6.t1